MPQAKKKQDETAEGLAAAGRLVKSEREAKPDEDPIARIQKFGMAELERKRKKEEEEKKKKKDGVVTPPKGLLTRLYESVMGSSDKK